MKKVLLSLTFFVAGLAMSSCTADLWDRYDDLDSRVKTLEAASEQMNSDIQALKTVVEAVNARLFVTEVVETEEACTFKFSNGEYVTITKGKDAPIISIRKDTDGCYYWTSDGEFLLTDDGRKLKVEGKDGYTPAVRINPDTKIWEISEDGGKHWRSTGIKASGIDSVFRGIDLKNADFIELEMADGSKLKLPRYNEKVDFAIDKAAKTIQIKYGQTKTFNLRVSEISDFFLLKTPAGWEVDLTDKVLTITAPAAGAAGETEGDIILSALTASRYSITIRQRVKAVENEMRILTFEDRDYAGDANIFGYRNWSSLISSGPNPDMTWYSYTNRYRWVDRNNTNLYNISLPAPNWWDAGVGISNHVKVDKLDKTETKALCIPYQDPKGNIFAVAYGYAYPGDPNYKRSYIAFADSIPRVIDHMYVMNTTMVAQLYEDGDPYDYFPAAKDTDFYKVIAIGYDVEGNEGKTAEFKICSGKKALKEWTKWDLSSLGKVFKVEFSFAASETFSETYEGHTYPLLPFYFAFDNVAVRFD